MLTVVFSRCVTCKAVLLCWLVYICFSNSLLTDLSFEIHQTMLHFLSCLDLKIWSWLLSFFFLFIKEHIKQHLLEINTVKSVSLVKTQLSRFQNHCCYFCSESWTIRKNLNSKGVLSRWCSVTMSCTRREVGRVR